MPTFGLGSREIQLSQTHSGLGMASSHLDRNGDDEEEGEYLVAESCPFRHKAALKIWSVNSNKVPFV